MTVFKKQKGALQAKLALKIITEGKKGLCRRGVAEHVGVVAERNMMLLAAGYRLGLTEHG